MVSCGHAFKWRRGDPAVRPFILAMVANPLCYDGEYNCLMAEGWLPRPGEEGEPAALDAGRGFASSTVVRALHEPGTSSAAAVTRQFRTCRGAQRLPPGFCRYGRVQRHEQPFNAHWRAVHARSLRSYPAQQERADSGRASPLGGRSLRRPRHDRHDQKPNHDPGRSQPR